SSRPLTMPSKTPDAVEQAIVVLRRAERLSRDEIAHRLKLAPRTVSRVLARHGMPPLWDLDPMTGEQVRASKKTTTRYEREHPGELVHMDVKKLGRIPEGGGWRAPDSLSTGSPCRRAPGPAGFSVD